MHFWRRSIRCLFFFLALMSGSWGRPAGGSGSRRRFFSSPRSSLVSRAIGDAQSLVLNSTLVVRGFASDGVTGTGVTPSLVSSNNFINFCANTPLTNGKQVLGGSCNPVPMGEFPDTDKLPSVRIFDPTNGKFLRANTTFSLSLNVNSLRSGVFTNPNENFLGAPQQVGTGGLVQGHHHLVIEEIDANSTAPTDARNFAFFAIISQAASQAGIIERSITGGLPEGYYRITVTSRASNHQPVLSSAVQTGSLDDVAYITVTADGSPGSTPRIKRKTVLHDQTRHYPRRKLNLRDDSQTSLTLLSTVVSPGLLNNGMDKLVQPGQSASATSSNNFINFCGSSTLPLIDLSVTARSAFCNPAPMGLLPSSDKIPTARITYPRNGDVILPNAPMTIGVAVANFASGNIANDRNYASAPQQLDASGLVRGHPYVVLDLLDSPTQITPTTPSKFSLFKGFSARADDTGVVTTSLGTGLGAGFYRMTVGLKTTNGVPVFAPVLQHGAIGDAIYFTVAPGGKLPTNQTAIVGARTDFGQTTLGSFGLPSQTSSGAPQRSGSGLPVVATSAYLGLRIAVGAALGGAALLALIILGIWLLMRRRKKKKTREQMLQWRPGGTIDGRSELGLPPPTPFVAGIPRREREEDVRSEDSVTVYMPMSTSPPTKAQIMAGLPPPPVAAKRPARQHSGRSVAPSYHTNATFIR
ncbi:hypothetical protein MIND_01109900 [Mycena indigotica]|uniref:Uncharacterized protein n=1 Tax=Mycena indigotica TaxID=2126181 RepID=A0A8H6SBH0_9AGAR|nr:uncharacterized protein MIND_01109900 [Mycena indigotica]KAF7295695.1 hypothetical protein MIND_01109900 [Mycena indigotica]